MECDGALKSSRGELQLWFRPHSNRRSRPGVVSVQSLRSLTRDNFGTPTWESREKKPFGCSLHGVMQGEPLAGREATAPSVIREIKEVQGREQVPRNGSLALPKDPAVKPFGPKGLLNV
jgi:hypothetical protein